MDGGFFASRRDLRASRKVALDQLAPMLKHFIVGKAPDAGPGQRNVEIGGNGFGKRRVAVSGHEFHGLAPARWSIEWLASVWLGSAIKSSQ